MACKKHKKITVCSIIFSTYMYSPTVIFFILSQNQVAFMTKNNNRLKGIYIIIFCPENYFIMAEIKTGAIEIKLLHISI